jgi:pseudaminic acid synthase
MEPKEFTAMTRAVRDAEKALGSVTYDLSEKAQKSRERSRSLFVVLDLDRGALITQENIRSIRPGFGIHPKHIKAVLGKRVNRDVSKGTPLTWEMLAE